MVPEHGTPIQMEDISMIIEAIALRQRLFRQESLRVTIGVVLANAGDRFAPVQCIKGEWEGFKADLANTNSEWDVPKCPNGHVLIQGQGMSLGWVTPPPLPEL